MTKKAGQDPAFPLYPVAPSIRWRLRVLHVAGARHAVQKPVAHDELVMESPGRMAAATIISALASTVNVARRIDCKPGDHAGDRNGIISRYSSR